MYYDVLCIMMYYVLWCIIYHILYVKYYSFYHIDIGQNQTQFLNVWHMLFGCRDHLEIWASGTVKTEVFSLSTPQQKSLTWKVQDGQFQIVSSTPASRVSTFFKDIHLSLGGSQFFRTLARKTRGAFCAPGCSPCHLVKENMLKCWLTIKTIWRQTYNDMQ